MSAKVRHEPVYLTLAVPDGKLLLAWAADADKRLGTQIVFRDASSRVRKRASTS